MKQTHLMMGMPITVEIVGNADSDTADDAAEHTAGAAIDSAFAYFQYVDDTFSTYKEDSEISRINQHKLTVAEASADMQKIFALAEETKAATQGYFDIFRDDKYDPSGLVKGWAIFNAAELLRKAGFKNYYVDAGGDIQAAGHNCQGQKWRVGIRNPFNAHEIVKVSSITDCGVATSGTYVRGQHIYNPNSASPLETGVLSLTVIGPNIYDADRFATAAFAMGEAGIMFIEQLSGFEGYQIDKDGRATFTSGFDRYTIQ